MNRFRMIAVTAVAGLVLVACGSAASSNSGAPSSSPLQAPASQGGGGVPSFTAGAAADLEALIPDTVGSLTMNKQSMAGSEFLAAPGSDPASIKFVEDLGVSPSDISMAIGLGFSADASSSLIMIVFRAAGADSDRLVSGMKDAMSAGGTPQTWTSTEVAGKSVEVTGEADSTVYLYAKDDILVFVSGDAASAEEAIRGLP